MTHEARCRGMCVRIFCWPAMLANLFVCCWAIQTRHLLNSFKLTAGWATSSERPCFADAPAPVAWLAWLFRFVSGTLLAGNFRNTTSNRKEALGHRRRMVEWKIKNTGNEKCNTHSICAGRASKRVPRMQHIPPPIDTHRQMASRRNFLIFASLFPSVPSVRDGLTHMCTAATAAPNGIHPLTKVQGRQTRKAQLGCAPSGEKDQGKKGPQLSDSETTSLAQGWTKQQNTGMAYGRLSKPRPSLTRGQRCDDDNAREKTRKDGTFFQPPQPWLSRH